MLAWNYCTQNLPNKDSFVKDLSGATETTDEGICAVRPMLSHKHIPGIGKRGKED